MAPELLSQVVVVGAFGLSILGLLFAPRHLLSWLPGWRDRELPWFASKIVYVPLLGVLALGSIHLVFNAFGTGEEMLPFVTWGHVWDTVADKYEIVFLILSFAYLSISLDRSGFFEFCSFKIVLFSRGNGIRLLVFMYLLCSFITFFTSNDIVIIAMTPIIIYIGYHAKIRNLIPLLVTQFIAANTLSMGLYIGSPTNIVLGDAAHMTFVDFFLWMFFPSLVACATTLVMVLLLFHFMPLRGIRMQRTFEVPERASEVHGTVDMWVKVGIFALCLGFLTASSFIGLSLWVICLATALTMLAHDLILLTRSPEGPRSLLALVSQRMPWAIAPFVLSFFTMVRALSRTGLTENAAATLVALGKGSLIKLSMLFGYVSAGAVNVMNDIPSTVFWADMIEGETFRRLFESSPREGRVIVYSLLVGVNPGCYLTIIGALAGLIWISIIKKWVKDDKQVTPTGWDLSFYGFLMIVPVIFFTCLAVVLEVVLFVKGNM